MKCLLFSIFSTWGCFLIVILYKVAPGVESFDLEPNLLGINKDNVKIDLDNALELNPIREAIRRRLDLYLNQVREVHGLPSEDDDTPPLPSGSKRRGRRAVIKADRILPGRRRRNITDYNIVGTKIVRVVYPLNPQPFTNQKLNDLNTITIKGYSYIFTLEESSAGTVTTVYTSSKDFRIREIARQLTPGATRLEVHEIGSNVYVLPVEYNETSSLPIDAGSILYKFDLSSKKLVKAQTIDTSYATALHIWTGTGEEANDCYLAVAPEYQIKSKHRTFEVKIAVYRWQGGYFDYVYSLPAKNPTCIRHARILSTGYLGVANYQDNTGSTSINSEIFRYNHKESKYVSFQKIRTQGAMNLEFFSVTNSQHEEFFLAIANHCETDSKGKQNYRVKSHIFKYGLDRFIPFQSFETYGAFQFLAVKTDTSSILVLGEISGIRVFQYNGWKFTPTNSYNFDFNNLNPSLIKIRPFYTTVQPSFAIASSEVGIEGRIYAMELEQKKDYAGIAAEFEGECKNALARIESENMAQLLEDLGNAPKTTDEKIVLESVELDSPVLIGNIQAQLMKFNGFSFDAELSKQLAIRERIIENFGYNLNELKKEASEVILRNEDRTINSEIHFNKLNYYGSPLKVKEVNAEVLNNIKLKDILPKLLHLDQKYSFDTVTIDDLITDQHIKVDKLNGDLLLNFALKSSEEQIFQAENRFLESLSVGSGILIKGLLDGVDLKNVDFLLKKGNQSFNGEMKIKNSSVRNLEADTVNGVNLAYYLEEGVSKSGDRKITGAKQFEAVDVTTFQSDGKISSVDINDLYEKAILTNGKSSQKFQERETSFEFLETNSINLSKVKLNDKWNLDDFVSISSGRNYSLDTVEFLRDTNIDNLQIEKSLNKIRILEDGDLDLILKDSSKFQIIGSKTLDSIHLEKDSESLGLIDGVELKNWKSEKYIELKQNRVRVGNFLPKGAIYTNKGLFVEKYGKLIFTGQDVTRLLQNSLRLDSQELPNNFRGVINFESVQVNGNTNARTINRLSSSDWLTQSENSATIVVRGRKTFKGDITLVTPSFANGLYYTQSRAAYGQSQEVFSQLQDLLIDGKNQTVQRNSVFESLLTVDRLDCPAENLILNGIPFKNLLLVDSDQTVEGKVTFSKSLEVEQYFSINGHLETKLLNGVDLNFVIADTLKTQSRTPQVFKSEVKFNDGLYVESLQTNGSIGGYNTTKLLSHVIRKDLPGIVHGSLTFAQDAKIKKKGMDYTGTMNGIPDEEWGEGFLLKSKEHQIIHTSIKFDDVQAKNITVVNNKVSNFNIVHLWNEILRIDKGGNLGSVTFVSDVVASDGVSIKSNQVNGHNIKEDILLTTSRVPQIITGEKTFTDGWKIDESLTVKYLEGIDYNQAAKFAFGKTEAKENLHVEGNLNLNNEPSFKSFNGNGWNQFISNIWMKDQPITFKKPIQFDTITLEEGGTLRGKLDGIDINQLENEYLSQSKDEHLTGKISFESTLRFEDLKISDIILKNGKINGVDLVEFKESVFLNGEDQTIVSETYFEELYAGNLELEDGLVEIAGMDLDKDAMTLHGENIINSEISIEELHVDTLTLGDDTMINEINLKEWIKNSVNQNGDIEINGDVQFAKAQFTKNIEVTGTVDGNEFGVEQILSLSHDQQIHGTTTVESNIITNEFQLKKNSLNKIDIQEVIETLILKDYGKGDLIVAGEKTFTQPLKADSMNTESIFQGHNMSETLNNLKPQKYLSLNESLEVKYQHLIELADELLLIADRRLVFLENFELESRKVYKESECLAAITSVSVITYNNLHQIVVSTWKREYGHHFLTFGNLTSLQMNSEYLEFQGKIYDFQQFEVRGQAYLIVSINSWEGTAALPFLESKLTKAGKGELEKGARKISGTFLLKLSNTGEWFIHQIIHGYQFRQIATFQLFDSNDDLRYCASTIEIEPSGGRVIILCFNSIKSTLFSLPSDEDLAMEIFQILPATSPILTTSLSTKENTFLLVASEGKNNVGSVVEVWIHTSIGGKFVKETSIPCVNVKDLDISKSVGQVLVAIGSGGGPSVGGGVSIYRYSEVKNEFEKFQSFSLRRVVAVKFQNLEPVSAQQLLYVQSDSGLNVYEYKGLTGFTLKHVLDTPDVVSIDSTSHSSHGSFNTYAIVASSTEIEVYRGDLNGLLDY